MYAYHALFSEDRRAFDEGRFWFQDALHAPEPFCPFDCVWFDYAVVALNQASTRLFVEPALARRRGPDPQRVCLRRARTRSPTRRRSRSAPSCSRGAAATTTGTGTSSTSAGWRRSRRRSASSRRSSCPELPEVEDEAVVTEGRGVGSSHLLLVAYDRLLEGLDRIWQYHFEFLNLGYGAYLVFYEICRQAFPDITDQTIAKMVSGIDRLVLRPDEELKRLARLALELGVAGAVEERSDEETLRAALAGARPGRGGWPTSTRRRIPGSASRTGTASTTITAPGSTTRRLPIGADRLVCRAPRGRRGHLPPVRGVLAERERITAEYRSLLPEDLRQPFDESLALARTVYPFIENHNFYIEHRYLTLFWNKVREFGALLAATTSWPSGGRLLPAARRGTRGARGAPARLELRRRGGSRPRLLAADRRATQVDLRGDAGVGPAACPRPGSGDITEPMAVMLWGITDERIREWLSARTTSTSGRLTGAAGSPGVAEGVHASSSAQEQLGELQQGEILVAPSTSPSWTPVFGRIAAAVLDSGGIMCHAAIVAREYGLPAVDRHRLGDEADQDRRSAASRRRRGRRRDSRLAGPPRLGGPALRGPQWR